MSWGLLILGLLLFVGLVVVHEFGHFLAARRNGVDVEEFGIGFPPKIWSKKMPSGFRLSINLLPLGGFVRLKGEHDADKSPASFGAASLKAKVKIMLAGVAMNVAAAFVLFMLLAAIGMPKLFDGQFTVASDTKIIQEVRNKDVVLVAAVQPGSPAEQAGIKQDDRILRIDNRAVDSPAKLSQLTEQLAGKSVIIELLRGSEYLALNLQLRVSGEQGYLGVTSASGAEGIELRRSTWSAPIVAAGLTKQFTQLTYGGLAKAIGNLFKGDAKGASQQVSGPLGVFMILRDGSNLGVRFTLLVIAVLSLTLALINVLPIPALDGGRLFVTLLFRALKKPLNRKTEELIHGAGIALLMALFVLITFVDIKRL